MGAHAHGALTSKGSFARAKQAVKKSGLARTSPRAEGNALEFHGVACVLGIYIYIYTYVRAIDVVARESLHFTGPGP